MSIQRLLPQACFIAMSLLVAAPAFAQVASEPPLTQEGDAWVLDAMGHAFTMPLPDWLDAAARQSGDVKPMVETVYVTDEKQALLEVYPKGESQAFWSTLYGARISLEADRPLTDYRAAVMAGYAQTCKPSLTGFFQLGEDAGDTLAPLGFVCGSYLDRLTGYAGQGEIMVMSFRKSSKGVAILYQEWRGDAFDPSQTATWPAPPATVQTRAQQLQDGARLLLSD